MKLPAALLVVVLGVTVVGWLKDESEKRPVRLTVNPQIGMARQSLCVSVIVPKHQDNRLLATVIDCERFYQSWQEQIPGEDAPYQRRQCVEKMPPGRCQIGVSLFRLDASEKQGIAVYRAEGSACFAGMETAC